MKLKKTTLAALICTVAGAAFFLQSAPPPPPPPAGQESFERFPPIPKDYWVQKLPQALEDGSNLIMRIRYVSDDVLPENIAVYRTSSAINFHDDGAGPDSVRRDGIYAAYVREDIGSFTGQVTALQNRLNAQGSIISFTGHDANMVTEIPQFDFVKFNAGYNVPIIPHLINAGDCNTTIKKQNSLFITALSVVEDPARTYNIVTGTGNPDGIWTFGYMIKGIVNANGINGTSALTPTGITAKDFLRKWLEGFVNGRTINGQTVAPRGTVLELFILPWIEKARGWPSNHYATAINLNQLWITDWNGTNEEDLLKYAPFKLSAIVNRIDLRGNSAYNASGALAGETRFIFSLIAPVDITNTFITAPAGTVPANNGGFNAGLSTLDWRGMNVILEYGNPIFTSCKLQDFARDWLDLSSYTISDDKNNVNQAYNQALENITHRIVDPGAGLTPNKVNYSALNRIRTNERIFQDVQSGIPGQSTWPKSDWELSQFELDPASGTNQHYLKPVAVTNTPVLTANTLTNIDVSTTALPLFDGNNSYTEDQSQAKTLIDWSFSHPNQILHDNHNLPSTYTYAGTALLQAGVARITQEQEHFWDFWWDSPSTINSTTGNNNYTKILSSDANAHPGERKVRQHLSLNTCQGCHSGENKTIFTQVKPVGYGESLDYWSAIPAFDQDNIDARFVRNNGESNYNALIAGTPKNNHMLIANGGTPSGYFQRVSAFLTGRKYNGPGNGAWEDDNYSLAQDPGDANLGGLFYVFDPADNWVNGADHTRPKADNVNGYNDLERRKFDLCTMITFGCSNTSLVLTIISEVAHIPTGID